MSSDLNPASCWQIDAQTATLTTETLVGKVELDNPGSGIHRLRYGKHSLSGRLLGIASGVNVIDGGWDLADSYSRGNDLVAKYHCFDEEQVSKQIYWTIHHWSDRQDSLLLDVVVSVQTDSLESYPRLSISTALPCDNLLFASNNTEGQESIEDLEAGTLTPRIIDISGCAIFRFREAPWSYVEMAHPADFYRWQGCSSEEGSWQSLWDIESAFLEKGVIRRFQLRGALIPRKNDLQTARQLLLQFAAEKPPITV